MHTNSLSRLRRTPVMRNLLQETYLHVNQLVSPLFVNESITSKTEIKSMPGQFQHTIESALVEVEHCVSKGISSFLIFGTPSDKTPDGSQSSDPNGIAQKAIRAIKEKFPDVLVIADVCLCLYTTHGHCGILNGDHIDHEATCRQLELQTLSYAEAGANWVAPSGMIDGMIYSMRRALNAHGYNHIAILSYAVKYASSFYGPFRDAVECHLNKGNRKTYQMNPANSREAIREAEVDLSEGADMLMVKPAMNYLDVISQVKSNFPEVPLCAYQISGEYAMLKAAMEKGWLNENCIMESLIAIKRAGADFIITYFAKEAADMLKYPMVA